MVFYPWRNRAQVGRLVVECACTDVTKPRDLCSEHKWERQDALNRIRVRRSRTGQTRAGVRLPVETVDGIIQALDRVRAAENGMRAAIKASGRLPGERTIELFEGLDELYETVRPFVGSVTLENIEKGRRR